jgi:glycerol-3-phosphate acyltransferase PlsX
MRGVDRPALGLLYHTLSGRAILLDIGANTDCRPEFLLQFAHLGKLYMQRVLNIPKPRIALLSTGEEEGKGSKLVRQGYQLLKEKEGNFIGNIEGKDLFQGMAEVVVTDGFTGNVLLKASEGLGEAFLAQIARPFQKDLKYSLVSLLLSPVIRAFKKRLDYNEYGGVPLLGVKGNVIIAHGRSKAKAIRSALRLANQMVEQKMPSLLTGKEDG